jgi:energy-coupling factor transporter ATP-binding protein EcfA2
MSHKHKRGKATKLSDWNQASAPAPKRADETPEPVVARLLTGVFPAVNHRRVREHASDFQVGLLALRIIERNIPGIDDPVYERDRDVWERVPRGHAKIFAASTAPLAGVPPLCTLVGARKFGYRDSPYGRRGDVVSAVAIEKETGECAHAAAFAHAGERFWVAGSKHVSLVFRDGCASQDLAVYEASGRHRMALKVGRLFAQELGRLSGAQRSALFDGLSANGWTASAEAIFADSQHIVDYNDRNELRWFALTSDVESAAGLAVACDAAKAFFEGCGLHAVARAPAVPYPGPAYDALIDDVARRGNSEGVVVYGHDAAGRVACMWKEKAYPYVMERVVREAVKRGIVGAQLQTYVQSRLGKQPAELRAHFAAWEATRLPFLLEFAAWLRATAAPGAGAGDGWELSTNWLRLQRECEAVPAEQRRRIAAEAHDLRPANASTVQATMFVGPPGSGKSTLARALMGLLARSGARPKWLNQDEAGGQRHHFLNAIKKALADGETTHIILDKTNLDAGNRQDYDELRLAPAVTVVCGHPEGDDALQALCVDRIMARGAAHRTLRADGGRAAVAESVARFVDGGDLPDDPSCIAVDVSAPLEASLGVIWAAMQQADHAPEGLPALAALDPARALADARGYELELARFATTTQLFACVTVKAPREAVLALVPAAALKGKQVKTGGLHVTTAFFGGAMDPVAFVQHARVVGQHVGLVPVAVVYDARGCAIEMRKDFPCNNPVAHVTIACAPGVAPVYSNELLAKKSGTVRLPIDGVTLDGEFQFL